MRIPVVAGVSGGVGTTTLALALHGRDAGVGGTAGADVLACRGTGESLRRAAAVVERSGPGPRPVLAVTVDGASPRRGTLQDLLGALRPRFSALVLLPHVEGWCDLPDPYQEAAYLLARPADRVPRPLRGYADALRHLAAEVAASGRLTGPRPAPPALPGPDAPPVRMRTPLPDPSAAPAPHRGIRFLDPSPGAVSRRAGRDEVPGVPVPPVVTCEADDIDLEAEPAEAATHPLPNVTRLPDRVVALRPVGVEQVG